MPAGTLTNPELGKKLLDALDKLSGPQPGFRSAHAKGAMCVGTFEPSREASGLTRAPHATRPSTPVTVRFSDSTGQPNIPDNHPASSPKGIAIRFHLAEHAHTDIIAHSTDGFPVRTGEEFVELLAAAAAGTLEAYLAGHPSAQRFAAIPKPLPTSFGREAFFGVTAFKFTNGEGLSRHGRFRIRPEAGTEYLRAADAEAKSPNFLFDELGQRLAKAPFGLAVSVQIAEPGDVVDDATVTWPSNRAEIPFGTVTVTTRVDDQAPERRKIIFDPKPNVDGIDPSGDPLIEARSDVYLMSGRKRRAYFGDGRR